MDRSKSDTHSGSLFSTGDIARFCETTVKQVNRWIYSGKLKAFQTPGGHYRITKDEFKTFLELNNMPALKELFKTEKKKLLIADDDAGLVTAITEVVKSRYKDIEIEAAHDGYEALIKTGDFKPDILIIDIRMPKIDGLEVCRRLRDEKSTVRTIKILAITGYTDAFSRETVIGSGADDYMVKPFKMKLILQHIKRLIE